MHKLAAIIVGDYAAHKGVQLPAGLQARITEAAKGEAYYERRLMSAVRRRYEEETDDNEFLLIMAFLIAAQLRRAYMEGLAEVGITEMDAGMENELFMLQVEEEGHARSLLNDIKIAILAGLGWAVFRWRMALWANRWHELVNRAVLHGGVKLGLTLMWELGATETHCTDCAGYAGQVKPAQEWDDIYRIHGHRPQARVLECKGYNCDCRLRVVKRV